MSLIAGYSLKIFHSYWNVTIVYTLIYTALTSLVFTAPLLTPLAFVSPVGAADKVTFTLCCV